MESAYAALAAGSLDPALRRQAEREAHKLTGGLGSFGMPAASEAARQLEQFWRETDGATRPGHLEAHQVPDVLNFLRHETDRPVPEGFEESTCSAAVTGPRIEAHTGAKTETVDIVLVEDDASSAEMLIAQFAPLGYKVRWFADGETALAALAVAEPTLTAHVILLDYDLPGSDGLSVLQQLRSHGVLATTRVVMLTAAAETQAVTRALNAGAHGYVAKPFRWSTLLDRVEECIDRTPPLFVLGPQTSHR
jgi:CheY-like chemotaxis protein/HPt (histidine-containing phosphotransfer) domain-containing protein